MQIDRSPREEKIIWDFLSKNFNEYAVAGIMGNLYAESGLKSTNLQNYFNNKLGLNDSDYTQKVDSGSYNNFIYDGAGYGIAQWTYWSRKERLLNFSKEKNTSVGDLLTQLDFLMIEFNSYYTSLYKKLKSATNVEEASNLFLLDFERPADTSEKVKQIRSEYGNQYYTLYSKSKEGNSGMIKEYKKGINQRLSTNFTTGDFDCQCHRSNCKSTPVDDQLVEYVQAIRTHFGKPVIVTSGFRCPSHNAEVGGGKHSRHMQGMAADIQIQGVSPIKIAQYAESIGILGIGLYDNFVHVDTRKEKAFWYSHRQEPRTTFGGTPQPRPVEPEIKPTPTPTPSQSDRAFGIGDEVQLVKGATYYDGSSIPSWLFNKKLYIRGISGGDIVVSYLPTGAISGVVNINNLIDYNTKEPLPLGELPVKPSKPAEKPTDTFAVGDKVKLKPGATYYDGSSIPGWLKKKQLFIRDINGDNISVSYLKVGAISGVVHKGSIEKI